MTAGGADSVDRTFFDTVYEGHAPWDIGAPQPDLMRLIDVCAERAAEAA